MKIKNKIEYRRWTWDDLDLFTSLQKELRIELNRMDPGMRIDYPESAEGKRSFTNYLKKDWNIVIFASINDQALWFNSGWMQTSLSHVKRGKCAYLDCLYVKPDLRNSWIGKQLIEEFTNRAKEKKADYLKLLVDVHNKWAIKLYQHLAFKPICTYFEKSLKR